MKKTALFVKDTLAGGVLFLLPGACCSGSRTRCYRSPADS